MRYFWSGDNFRACCCIVLYSWLFARATTHAKGRFLIGGKLQRLFKCSQFFSTFSFGLRVQNLYYNKLLLNTSVGEKKIDRLHIRIFLFLNSKMLKEHLTHSCCCVHFFFLKHILPLVNVRRLFPPIEHRFRNSRVIRNISSPSPHHTYPVLVFVSSY